jgi:hypothetical protein
MLDIGLPMEYNRLCGRFWFISALAWKSRPTRGQGGGQRPHPVGQSNEMAWRVDALSMPPAPPSMVWTDPSTKGDVTELRTNLIYISVCMVSERAFERPSEGFVVRRTPG